MKPCEPARHPLRQVERLDSHRGWIHTYSLYDRDLVFATGVANATRFAVAGPTESSFPAGCTSHLRRRAKCPGRTLLQGRPTVELKEFVIQMSHLQNPTDDVIFLANF